jgi:hypothetical protein
MNEDGCRVPWQNQIWAAGKRGRMDSESKSFGMKILTNDDLWFRVRPSDSRHHPAAGDAVDDVQS